MLQIRSAAFAKPTTFEVFERFIPERLEDRAPVVQEKAVKKEM